MPLLMVLQSVVRYACDAVARPEGEAVAGR